MSLPGWISTQLPDLSGVSPLSRGGQKQVFVAQHVLHGDVVLKVMHSAAEPERVDRELLAVQEVKSPRVPRILEQGIVASPSGDEIWFVEERVNGQTLRQLLASGPLDPPYVLRFTLHIAEALLAAEGASIVHRDVKPENILCDPSHNFWLIDFGLARHLSLSSLTSTANAFGNATWGYAPLEQCRNMKRDIDSRADMFAFGVTIYECATGSNPFRAGARDHLEILRRIEATNLPRLLLPIPAAESFADLVAALVQRQRIHRPRSAKEVYDWVTDICGRAGVK